MLGAIGIELDIELPLKLAQRMCVVDIARSSAVK